MRIAIISDIHANLEALEQALSIIESKSVDTIVCLGDVVGYGANPNECTALVRKAAAHTILGNHDQAALDLSVSETFTRYARISALWTYRQLTDENKEFIQTLPHTLVLGELLFVHASPYEPESWHYILTAADARDNYDHFHQSVCFVGHSHEARIFCKNHSRAETGKLNKADKYIINVGSVGQPRDGDWRLSFGIFDTEEWIYENVRAEYDVTTASTKIRKAGLPPALADRLFVGR
jgi:putative phosphoesterase